MKKPKKSKQFSVAPREREPRRFLNIKPEKIFTNWAQSARGDKIFWLFFASWLLPLLLITTYTSLFFKNLPQEIPLFYSRVWGQPQLAKNTLIFLPLAGTALLGIGDFAASINFHNRDRVLSYFLAGTASLVSLLTSITVFNIINLMK